MFLWVWKWKEHIDKEMGCLKNLEKIRWNFRRKTSKNVQVWFCQNNIFSLIIHWKLGVINLQYVTQSVHTTKSFLLRDNVWPWVLLATSQKLFLIGWQVVPVPFWNFVLKWIVWLCFITYLEFILLSRVSTCSCSTKDVVQ